MSLNNLAIKNKFSIPLVNELMDELNESKFFSELDLQSGYHQVRMRKEDIAKTAFQTHQRYFEFKVMPFSLTNAHVIFQALMNSILESYLRRFVSLFFDYILIFSSSIELHVEHLKLVMETLRNNQLFAKLSKCTFCEES